MPANGAAGGGGSSRNVGPALPPGGPGGSGGKKAGIANVGRAPSFKGTQEKLCLYEIRIISG